MRLRRRKPQTLQAVPGLFDKTAWVAIGLDGNHVFRGNLKRTPAQGVQGTKRIMQGKFSIHPVDILAGVITPILPCC